MLVRNPLHHVSWQGLTADAVTTTRQEWSVTAVDHDLALGRTIEECTEVELLPLYVDTETILDAWSAIIWREQNFVFTCYLAITIDVSILDVARTDVAA